jgi:DNA-binding transcriptional LysR family regulator
MAAFRAAHPKVALCVAEGTTPVQLDWLGDGDVDVAVVSSYPQRLHRDDVPVPTIHAATWRGIAASAPVAAFVRCLVLTAREMRQPRR